MKLFITLGGLLLLAACGTMAKVQPVERNPAQELVVTPAPITLPGDSARGAVLFTTFQPAAGIACSTCHRVDTEERFVGPGLRNVSKRAAQRIPGVKADEYLRNSIVDAGAYVVEDYPDIMTKNFRLVFSAAQLDDLVAYLMTL